MIFNNLLHIGHIILIFFLAFLLKALWIGKCLSNMMKNFLPIFIFTCNLKSRVSHILFFFTLFSTTTGSTMKLQNSVTAIYFKYWLIFIFNIFKNISRGWIMWQSISNTFQYLFNDVSWMVWSGINIFQFTISFLYSKLFASIAALYQVRLILMYLQSLGKSLW